MTKTGTSNPCTQWPKLASLWTMSSPAVAAIVVAFVALAPGRAAASGQLGGASSQPAGAPQQCAGADWPTYRHDRARSGRCSETVDPKLVLNWTYRPVHRPEPAWPPPAEELPRMHVDNALHVAVADGRVYFGCPTTGQVRGLDLASGRVLWSFDTEGPVRFAPTFNSGSLYFGSDDGYVYCLDADTGSLRWKYRPGPSGEKVIGNGRVISLWPIRTGVLVDRGVAYATAGVFPYEGVYVCALQASTGEVIWKSRDISDHVYELEFGGVSPHGYLVASKDKLFVPSGRAMPAAFDRRTGKLLFYASPGGHRGGVWALLDGQRLVAGTVFSESQGLLERPAKIAYDANTGQAQPEAFAWFPAIDLVPARDALFIVTDRGVSAVNRQQYSDALKRGARWIKERQTLERRLFSLRLRVTDSVRPDPAWLAQIKQLSKRLVQVREKEETLRESCLIWHCPAEGLASLIQTGSVLYAGGDGFVLAVDASTGQELWRHPIVGTAVGLAAADGRLLVSTDAGPIYCFGRKTLAPPAGIGRKSIAEPAPKEKLSRLYREAASAILRESGITKGYCLLLQAENGDLALGLARLSDLKIVCLEKVPRKRAAMRQRLQAARLLGTRVVVEPWDIGDLPPYFANLVIACGSAASSADAGAPAEQILRVLRPCGGVFLTCTLPTAEARVVHVQNKYVRSKLQGAGSWRGLYANPQNTACSEDKLVRGPLGVLWFGEPGPRKMVDRHARTNSPVSIGGRLFVPGEELIQAYDAYNGTFLWETPVPGAVRARVDVDGGNLALTEDSLYVAARDVCYRLDTATGRVVRKYHFPPASDGSDRRWGFVCPTNAMLLGTRALPLLADYGEKYRGKRDVLSAAVRRGLHRSGAFWRTMAEFPPWGSQQKPDGPLTARFLTADAVFALDLGTGALRWLYEGRRIANITLSVGDGTVFFAEGAVSPSEREEALAERKRLAGEGLYEPHLETDIPPDQRDVRRVVAVDLATGQVLWKKAFDLTGCGGSKMGSAYARGLLLFFGHFSNHDQRFFKRGQLAWRRITAIDGRTGRLVWSRPLNYLRRPVIVGDRIIIEPRACDLRTGKIVPRRHPITGKEVPWEFLRPGHSCGVTSASAHAIFYRSYCAAIYELDQDQGLSLFGGIRTGCWLDIIAAGGLMLMPERSSGCTCSYPLRCSVALVHKPDRPRGNWPVFISSGVNTPVEHLALNLGAPGDRRDSRGVLWFGYPRVGRTYSVYNAYPQYGLRLTLNEKLLADGGFFSEDSVADGAVGSEPPWLWASGCRGLLALELPLIDPQAGEKPASYTVRVGISAARVEGTEPQPFAIKLQGRVVAKAVGLTASDDSRRAVVQEFRSVRVTDRLLIELVPSKTDLSVESAPVVNFVEAIKERTRQPAKTKPAT